MIRDKLLCFAILLCLAITSPKASAEDTQASTVIRLGLRSMDMSYSGPTSEQEKTLNPAVLPSPHYELEVVEQFHVSRQPPRQRHPELSPDQMVIIAYDDKGKEISRTVMRDPRLIRAEVVGPSGELQPSDPLYSQSLEFIVTLPDDPAISMIKLFHPSWTGTDFVLNPVAEAKLP